MTKSFVSAMVLATLAGTTQAQTVEFRVVQEVATTNSLVTAVPPAPGTELNAGNATGHFAVQARVTGGAALSGFAFNIAIAGEPDTNGTIARNRIQDSLGVYYNGVASTTGAAGATVGMAKQYTYLAGINPAFGGQINTSSGTFTNSAGSQEIGLITGSNTGAALLSAPGMDPDGEGNPATWSGYGVGAAAPNGATATLDPTVGSTYFAQGQFIDIYRFRYTATNFSARTLTLTIQAAQAQSFSSFLFNSGSWGAMSTAVPAGNISIIPLSVAVTPAPGAAALLGIGGLVAARRRRQLA